MNERIKELMPKPWSFPYPDREMYSKEQFEHFVKLLIEECSVPMITMAQEMDKGPGKHNPVEVNAMFLHQGLMKYFGIKE